MPTISVVMSVYMEPIEWLCQSIDSILQQTFTDFEFIIISDNPSNIEGNLKLKGYADKDSRIVLIFNEENIGLTKSLNKGIAIAKGKYIARMDADDISMSNRLEIQYAFMENNPEIGVCGTNIFFIGDISTFSEKIKSFPIKHNDIKNTMLFDNPFAHSSVIMRRIINDAPVQYDETATKAQDYKLWYDLLKRGAKFANIDIVGLKYRLSNIQISSKQLGAQMSVADTVRGLMVRDYCHDVTVEEICLHNETCKTKKTSISLDAKLSWLTRLSYLIPMSTVVRDYMFRIWYGNCMAYGSIKDIRHYPYFSVHMIFKRMFLKSVIRSLFYK